MKSLLRCMRQHCVIFWSRWGRKPIRAQWASSSTETISRSASSWTEVDMARNARKIAELMGAEIVGPVPDVGAGAFGAARLAKILKERLQPGQGRRPGRPSNFLWVRR